MHGMRPIILGYFFPTIDIETRTFHLRNSMVQVGGGGGNFFQIFLSIFIGPMKGYLWLEESVKIMGLGLVPVEIN